MSENRGKTMRYYIMSDIHSFTRQMENALRSAGFFRDTERHKLVLLGDNFDRGSEAKEMQSFLIERLKDPDTILVRGNHEDLYERLAWQEHGCPTTENTWNGTFDTACQLTGFSREEAENCRESFVQAIRNTPYYRQIIPAMVDYHETRNYVFTHGYLPVAMIEGRCAYRPDWRQAGSEDWKSAHWLNGMEVSLSVHGLSKTVVCGHTSSSFGHSQLEHYGPEFGEGAVFTPYYGRGIIGIDACTIESGFVNCLVLEDEEISSDGTT